MQLIDIGYSRTNNMQLHTNWHTNLLLNDMELSNTTYYTATDQACIPCCGAQNIADVYLKV